MDSGVFSMRSVPRRYREENWDNAVQLSEVKLVGEWVVEVESSSAREAEKRLLYRLVDN
jgi:hypothetical protein